MPSIRKPLSTRQKLIAMYTDPNVYALAHHVATNRFQTPPGHRDYRRNATCFLLDLEARLHTNRQKTARNLVDDRQLWDLRRDLALRITGRDMLLPQAPSADDVRKWRGRFVPPETSVEPGENQASELATINRTVTAFAAEYERLAVARAVDLGQFGARKHRNLAKLKPSHVVSADGTYVRAHSQVEEWVDPETGEIKFLGSRSKKARKEGGRIKGARVQQYVNREPKAGRDTMGVNHVAILTRTRYGRVILSVERALGGEVHAALTAMDRIAPLANGGIWALTYDKALSGWQIDYLLANHGIIAVTPPSARKKEAIEVAAAAKVADRILAARASAQAADDQTNDDVTAGATSKTATSTKSKAKKSKKGAKPTARMKTAVVTRVLGKTFNVAGLVADVEAGRPVGAGLALGTSLYLDSHGDPVPVASRTYTYKTVRHQVGAETCEHPLHVDDGALWDTRLERGLTVKDQRLTCVNAETKTWERTGWQELHSTYRFVCEYTGELLTEVVHHKPSGDWKDEDESRRPRSARHAMMVLARCDKRWRKIYGLRNDCESWFSWLKMQLLDDKRAASLDLNHQLLDVLYAGVLTNAISLFNYRREQAR